MKILAVSYRQPGAQLERIQDFQKPETAMVWEAIKNDFIREIYFDPDNPQVAVIFEAESISTVETWARKLPMVEAGLIWFHFMRLGPYAQLEVQMGDD